MEPKRPEESNPLINQLNYVGIPADCPGYLNGLDFSFTDGVNQISGKITGTSTSDDGLPVVEVSNQYFAGLKIKDIILLRASESKGHRAQLTTTETDIRYRCFIGELDFWNNDED